MKYVFGPVPSRRLGKSLGIDPIPLKTCNWNCVYCQLGRTRPLSHVRGEVIPRQAILAEVQQALTAHRPGEIDWVTFVGSGEPTLHSGLGWLIAQVKNLTDLPVAVITNGSLLGDQEVCQGLTLADAVLPTLDAGNPTLYFRINRPWPKLTFENYLSGLQRFRQVYRGKLWIEVMLIRGVNDTEEALVEIASALEAINPDQVHLTLPVRPPAESWVRPSDESGIQRALAILGGTVRLVQPDSQKVSASSDADLNSAILGVITRHPMTIVELCAVMDRWSPDEIQQALSYLQNTGKARDVVRRGVKFWSAAGSYYSEL